MSFENPYANEKLAKDYIRRSRGYDGRYLIRLLRRYLPTNRSILELGMGPGVDLDILSETYIATGSDLSEAFLEIYRKNNPGTSVILLNAIDLNTKDQFDAIYSNKVLQHLTREELHLSFQRQIDILTSRGILCHSFWKGDTSERDEFGCMYYTKELLWEIANNYSDVLLLESYAEMETDDSIVLIAQKR